MSDHLIAEANRHAKALHQMTLPTTQPTQRDIQWYIEECIYLRKHLDLECASKREHLRIACREINELKVKAGFYEREIARLRADGARLDFILSLGSIARFSAACSKLKIESTGEQWLHDARRAIDAARREAQP